MADWDDPLKEWLTRPRVGMGEVQASPSSYPDASNVPAAALTGDYATDMQIARNLAAKGQRHGITKRDAVGAGLTALGGVVGAMVPGVPAAMVTSGVMGGGMTLQDPDATVGDVALNAAFNSLAGGLTAKYGPELADYIVKQIRAGNQRGHIVFHGTPATWAAEEGKPLGQFRRTFKHTGEGGAYKGAGGYVAEAPQTAEAYRQGLTKREVLFREGPLPPAQNTPQSMAQQYVWNRLSEGMDPDAAIADARAYIKASQKLHPEEGKWSAISDEIEAMNPADWKVKADDGSLYALDFPDELLPRVLDFDAPLSKQTPEVREALRKAGVWPEVKREVVPPESAWGELGRDPQTHDVVYIEGQPRVRMDAGEFPDPLEKVSGEDLYQALVRKRGGRDDAAAAEAASQALREAGIPAHRFLDQGSRGAGKGTRNFVVYDPDTTLKTVGRYNSLEEYLKAQTPTQ